MTLNTYDGQGHDAWFSPSQAVPGAGYVSWLAPGKSEKPYKLRLKTYTSPPELTAEQIPGGSPIHSDEAFLRLIEGPCH